MKILKIANVGELDSRLLFLLGASTKKNDSSKIGQFGTGLKYAISYLIRNDVAFSIFVGEDELNFSTKNESIRDNEFLSIHCNDQPMNITTEYGYQWEAWEAIREIWCNAKDEVKYVKNVKDYNSFASLKGKKDWTTFYIEVTEEIGKVIENWSDHFVTEKPIFENSEYAVFKNKPESLGRIYKNGILVKVLDKPSLYNYDLKNAELNELRQYLGTPTSSIEKILLNSCPEVSKGFISFLSEKKDKRKDYFEGSLDFSWIFTPVPSEVLRENFKGFLYLHPDSTMSESSHSIKLPISLFDRLKDAGLICERIEKKHSGGYYGSSSSSVSNGDLQYKSIHDSVLHSKVCRILEKYKSSYVEVETVVPFNSDFEIAIQFNKLIISAELGNLNEKDLEVIVITGLLQLRENGIYKAFKRVLKMALSNKLIANIIFK